MTKGNKKTKGAAATATPADVAQAAQVRSWGELDAKIRAHPLFDGVTVDGETLRFLMLYCHFRCDTTQKDRNYLPEMKQRSDLGAITDDMYAVILKIAGTLDLTKDYKPIETDAYLYHLEFNEEIPSSGGDGEDDSDSESEVKPHLANVGGGEAFLTGALHESDAGDLSRLDMVGMYGYLVNGMSNMAKGVFNSILKMEADDKAKICWALKMGNVPMMSKPMSDHQIQRAAGLKQAEWVDPYEYNTVLNDTIVTRVMAQAGYEFYSDPGADDKRVVICHLGAVVIHTAKNVAFNVEENTYVLNTFMHLFETDHPDIARIVAAKHALLPSNPIDGVYMKYRPKKMKVVLDNKRVDSTRFDFTIKKAGAYPEVDFKRPLNFDYLAIAMVSVGPSPMALFSAVNATKGGRKLLDDFAALAHKVLPVARNEEINTFYDRVTTCVRNGTYSYGKFYVLEDLSSAFEKKLEDTMLVTIAKDKGISSDISAILQPFGCVTLQIAEALYTLNPDFNLALWSVYSGVDVANQLKLNIAVCDNLSAPGRNGNCAPLAANVTPGVAITTATRAVTKAARYTYTAPRTVGAYYMDLAFNVARLAVTDPNAHNRNLQKHKASAMDYFAHDYRDADVCCAGLVTKSKDGKILKPSFDMFVVVFPVFKLTPAFCKMLFSQYRVSAALGSLAMNFSVYLIGSSLKPVDKDYVRQASGFASKCADMIYRRLVLFGTLYQGYPGSPRDIVRMVHRTLEDSEYIKGKVARLDAASFLTIMGKVKKVAVDHTTVLSAAPEIDFKDLSTTIDTEFDDSFGVAWVDDVPLAPPPSPAVTPK